MAVGTAAMAAALVLTLAGCGGSGRPLTDQEFCARQAENDPVVKQLIMKGAGNLAFQMEGADQRRAAEQDARLACLRSRGVVPPGGVERPKPA